MNDKEKKWFKSAWRNLLGYSFTSTTYRVYNKSLRIVIESIYVVFDELITKCSTKCLDEKDISMDFMIRLPKLCHKYDSIWVIMDWLTKSDYFFDKIYRDNQKLSSKLCRGDS